MTKLNYEDWKYIHDMILFQRLLDHKNKKRLDSLHVKILDNLNDELEKEESNENKSDNKVEQ